MSHAEQSVPVLGPSEHLGGGAGLRGTGDAHSDRVAGARAAVVGTALGDHDRVAGDGGLEDGAAIIGAAAQRE